MKKMMACLTAIILVLVTFTGCGGNEGSKQPVSAQDTKGVSETGTESGISSGKVQTVTFLDTNPFPERTAFLEQAIADFQAIHPDIRIEMSSVPWDEAYKKLVTMGSSNTLPDVVTGDVGVMLTLARAGWIADVSDIFNQLPQSDFSSAILAAKDAYTFQDKVYAIPDGYLCQGIFVRTDWLKDLGYNADELQNWTWDQYYDIIQKTTDKSKQRYGIAFRGGNNGNLRLYEYMLSNLEVAGAFPEGTSRSIFEDPRALDLFVQFFRPYMEGYAPTDSINWGFKEMVEGFINGQCATLNQTPEVAITCESSMEEGTWEILRQPVKEGAAKNYMTFGYTSAYMMAEKSEAKEGAAEFIAYLSSPQTNTAYCKAIGVLPIYASGLQDEFFQSANMKSFSDQLLDPKVSYAAQPTELTQWGYFLSEYSKLETQKYMSGKQSAEETLSHLAGWMKENYEKDVK